VVNLVIRKEITNFLRMLIIIRWDGYLPQ